MIKKVVVALSVLAIIVLVGLVLFGFLKKETASTENVIVYIKQTSIGTKDTKLVGYFSNDILERYEMSYYMEYSDVSSAKADYDRMLQSVPGRDDIIYTYTLDNNKLYTKMNHIVAKMDEKTVQTIFKTSNKMVAKKDFDNYAKSQGYVRQ